MRIIKRRRPTPVNPARIGGPPPAEKARFSLAAPDPLPLRVWTLFRRIAAGVGAAVTATLVVLIVVTLLRLEPSPTLLIFQLLMIVFAVLLSEWVLSSAYERHVTRKREEGDAKIVDELISISFEKTQSRNVEEVLVSWQYRLAKRALDLFVASVGLMLLAPVLLVISILIKLDSSGPALYGVQRLGARGQPFRMFKFRTIVADFLVPISQEGLGIPENVIYEQDQKGVHRISRDPRLTRIGRFLRLSALDELPQLINVLKGDMSLVGPTASFTVKRIVPVRPGLVGNHLVVLDSSESEPQELDATEYLQHWSLWLDLKILLMTIPMVLRGRGGY